MKGPRPFLCRLLPTARLASATAQDGTGDFPCVIGGSMPCIRCGIAQPEGSGKARAPTGE
jgi:hypothetical protein